MRTTYQYHKILTIARIVVTFFIILLVPIYWKSYGPQNFLWFSDVGLFLTAIALWVKSPLIMSMIVVGILPFEIIWAIDFVVHLFKGSHWLGVTNYMFDPNLHLFLRGMSFFHLFLPLIWIWFLLQWGYDKRAFWYQTVLVWVVLLLTYFFTDPQKNINAMFLPSLYQWTSMPDYLWLIILLIGIPLLIYWPTHWLLKQLIKASYS